MYTYMVLIHCICVYNQVVGHYESHLTSAVLLTSSPAYRMANGTGMHQHNLGCLVQLKNTETEKQCKIL